MHIGEHTQNEDEEEMTQHNHGNMAIRGAIAGIIFGVGLAMIIFEIFTTIVADTQSIINIGIGIILFFFGILLRRYARSQMKMCEACRNE